VLEACLEDFEHISEYHLACTAAGPGAFEVVLEECDGGGEVTAQIVVKLSRQPGPLARLLDLERSARRVVRRPQLKARLLQLIEGRYRPGDQYLARPGW
jgi:hypothetical protein